MCYAKRRNIDDAQYWKRVVQPVVPMTLNRDKALFARRVVVGRAGFNLYGNLLV